MKVSCYLIKGFNSPVVRVNSSVSPLSPENSFVFYSHSFDSGKADAGSLGTARWSQLWYFLRCGPEFGIFLFNNEVFNMPGISVYDLRSLGGTMAGTEDNDLTVTRTDGGDSAP